MGAVVAEPYAALTTVPNGRLLLPLNSIRGQHDCTMGATCTQASTLLILLVLTRLNLCPQARVYMLGQLETRDKAITTTATVWLQSSQATTTHIHRQPSNWFSPEPSQPLCSSGLSLEPLSFLTGHSWLNLRL